MEQQRFVRKNTTLLDAQRRLEKKRTRRTVFYAFLLIFVSLVFVGVCFAVFLNVETIEITGNEKYTADDIISRIPVSVGENIYSFNAAETEALIRSELPYIGEVEINRKLPTTLLVTLTEEKPVFAADIANDYYILSADLRVLERVRGKKASESGLIVLTLGNVRRCIVGETVQFVDSRTYDAVVELYHNFSENFIDNEIISLDVTSRFDIYFNYDERFRVYLGDMENADIKIRLLVGILEQLYDDSKGTIDLSDANEAAVALS